jgi:glycosyltransferase involved in cell wall biosynthesis
MKVCLISSALPEVSCGIGDYTDALARSLAGRGHEVVVITTASPDLRPPSDYRVVPLQTSWSIREAGRIAAVARRQRPDVLHLQFPGTSYGRGFGACFAPWVTRLRGSKPLLVTTLHEFRTLRLRNRTRLALAVSACDLVISPDPGGLASIRRHLRWRPGLATALIPLAPTVWPSAQSDRADETLSRSELTIGFWGFIRPDKGVDLLLEAFAQVVRTRPARLVLAGDPGPEAEYIASIWRRADELGISAYIETTGRLPVEELSAVLRTFDVCCLPYRDGLTQNRGTYAGTVAHGLYAVTTTPGQLGFEADTNTAFVPPNDLDALVSAILDAPNHPRTAIAATHEYEWGKIADLHLAAYRKARG